MTITFITHYENMTFKHYLNQAKIMIEWRLNMILAKNPQLVKLLGNRPHPSIRKYSHLFDDDDDDGEN